MPLYRYSAVGDNGELTRGTYSGGDKSQLIQMILEKKQHPVHIEEVVEKKDVAELSFFQKIGTKDIAVFCRQFSTMLNAGVTIIKCLDILSQQTEKKRFRNIISELYDSVQKGETFSEALRKHMDIFPEILINMVEAGEVSGSLDSIMNRMAVYFEKQNKLANKVKGAMVYPIVLSILAVLVVIFLLTFVMPTFFSMFTSSGVSLPVPTRVLLGISGIIKSFWYVIILVVIAAIYTFRRYISTNTGRLNWDRLKITIPIIKGSMVKIITSRFTRTLSTLLTSGIPLLQAMEVVAKVVGNRVVSDGILNAREEIRKGVDLAGSIRRIEVFPPMVDSMIRIGEESGTLDDILAKTSEFYDEEAEAALQRLTALLEPLIIVFMAGIIGFIVISMALPMFDMMKTVS